MLICPRLGAHARSPRAHYAHIEHCGASEHELTAWVAEGVLDPEGESASVWKFAGASLRRAQRATHLAHDLEINPPGIALALDLLDRIEALEARLVRLGGR